MQIYFLPITTCIYSKQRNLCDEYHKYKAWFNPQMNAPYQNLKSSRAVGDFQKEGIAEKNEFVF